MFLLCLAQVDNKYVLKKLQVLLLAVARKDWYRLPSEDEVKDDVRPMLWKRERGGEWGGAAGGYWRGRKEAGTGELLRELTEGGNRTWWGQQEVM